MSSGNFMKRPSSVLAVALQIAAWTSAVQKDGVACPESAAPLTVAKRVARVREMLADRTKEINNGTDSLQLAQWANWPNWGNWNNWHNWNNWADWSKY